MDIFPDNTLLRFTDKLSLPIDMEAEWVVGIQEMFYPVIVDPSYLQIMYILFFEDRRPKRKKTFTYMNFESFESLIEKLNADIAKEIIEAATESGYQKKAVPPILTVLKELVQIGLGEIDGVGIQVYFSSEKFVEHLGFDPKRYFSEASMQL